MWNKVGLLKGVLASTLLGLVCGAQISVAASSSVTGPKAAVLPFCDAWCRDAQSLPAEVQACVGQRYGINGFALDYQAMSRSCAQAAAQGDATAQTLLGEIHFLGLGVDQDFTLAYQWYQQAAAQQHAHAELMMYEMTRLHLVTVAAQPPQQWLQRAAQSGHPQARQLLQAAL